MSTVSMTPQSPALSLLSTAVAVPALTSQVRPALVLPERQARGLLEAAAQQDVGAGGCFAAGPAGIQLWSGPFDGPGGTKGAAVHLGSVDWTYNTPVKHWAMVYRVMVTRDGVQRGETTASVLGRVLALTGLTVEGDRLSIAQPPARDPFRSKPAAPPEASAAG